MYKYNINIFIIIIFYNHLYNIIIFIQYNNVYFTKYINQYSN